MEQNDEVQSILEIVKTDKGIEGFDYDNVLSNFIKQASDMVCIYVGEDKLPTQLQTIVVRITEAHYIQTVNDADGAKSYSEEGASWSFQDNELDPYMSLLDRYINNRDSNGSRGSVFSW